MISDAKVQIATEAYWKHHRETVLREVGEVLIPPFAELSPQIQRLCLSCMRAALEAAERVS